jgi:hypothetical protein
MAGYQVFRQPRAQFRAQLGEVGRTDEEGDEGRRVPRHDRHLRETGCAVHDRELHLGRLHPEAADLHLPVLAAEGGELAVRQHHPEVTRAVAAGPVPVGDEPPRGQLGIAVVPGRQADARDVDLPDDTGRNGSQVVVQDGDLGAVDRRADRRQRGKPLGHGETGDHVRLGRPVLVLEQPARAEAPDLAGDA